MKLPKNLTEKEVLDTIENVVNRLASKFRFGYHGIEDIKQQGRLHALKGLEKYDEQRPLENFLWTHVRNRLYNDKRDKYERPDKPCYTCPEYDVTMYSQCKRFTDKSECYLYHGWFNRNSSKKNIMRPIELSEVSYDKENNMKIADEASSTLLNKELHVLLDKHIPVDLRSDYLKLKYNLKLPKYKRVQIEQLVLQIVKEHGDTDDRKETG